MRATPGKRALSLLLALLMCLTALPATSLAGYDGTFDIFVFDNNAGGNNETVSALTLDASGTARFGISLDLSAAFPNDIVYVKMFASESNTWYTLYEDGSLKYGASADEFTTGFLSVVTIPNMAEGSYLVETAVKHAGGNDLFYVSSSEIRVGGGAGPAAPAITTSELPSGKAGEPYSFTLTGSNVTTWSATGLPDTLTLDAATGVISGTPAAEGSYTVNVTASDGTTEAHREFTLTIRPAATYTVRFSLLGGSGAVPDPVTAPYGTEITLPEAASKAGYAFAGWFDGTQTYAAGAAYTITKTVTVSASWTALPGVTVTVPADLGKVTGSVWLEGTRNGSDGGWQLWSGRYRKEADLPSAIDVKAASLGEYTYTALTLYAVVDGQPTAIAAYTGAVQAGETQMTVALQSRGVLYTVLNGVEVAGGLTEGADYTVSRIRQGETYISPGSLPVLVSSDKTFAVKLNGVQSSPVYASYDWETEQSGLAVSADHILRLAEPAGVAESIAVSGVVTWDGANGGTVSYCTVQATQELGGVCRTATANTDSNGAYTIRLFPGAEASFRVLRSGGALYVAAGGSLDDPADGSVQNLTVRSVALTAEVNYQVAAGTDQAAVERYLSAMGWMGRLALQVTGGGKSDAFTLSPLSTDPYSFHACLRGTASAAAVDQAALSCTLSGSIIDADLQNSVTMIGGTGVVSFTPTLRPGVVAKLWAAPNATTFSAFYAFYDADGQYLGESGVFYVDRWGYDYAAACPAGTTKIALVPGCYAGTLLRSERFDSLSDDKKIHVWENLSLPAGTVLALEDLTLAAAGAENAAFVTKPNSTLFAGAESFLTASDLISFTGSIGLDAGLAGGRLTRLYIDPKSETVGEYRNTAPVQTLVIGGKSYTPVDGGMASIGSYYFDFADDGIELPCSFTVYCNPGNMAYDMQLTVTANVRYQNGFGDNQLIGSARVARPGATLHTLSTYVCEDRIIVSGTAQRGERVTIYDDGAVIGSAVGDSRWGEWTALVPLYGTDPELTTVHELYAVTESGTVSGRKTVIHNSAGPQLKQFTMSWSPYGGTSRKTINMGDAYTFVGAMYDTAFEAKFANPEKLLTKTGWSSKVVFKVYTTDGEIRFLEATESGSGVFTAAVDTVLRTSVAAAEVMYEPLVPRRLTVDKDGVVEGSAPAEYTAAVKETAAIVRRDMNDENALYPTASWVVEYDAGGAPSRIHFHSADVAGDTDHTLFEENEKADETFVIPGSNAELAETVRKYYDAGMKITGAQTAQDSRISLQSWLYSVIADASALNHIAYDERTGDAGASRSRAYTLTRLFKGGTYRNEAITAEQAFNMEKQFMEKAKTVFPDMSHTKLILEKDGDSYDVYRIVLTNPDSGLEDCDLTVTFLACDGVCTMTAAAIFSPQYCSKTIAGKWTEIRTAVQGANPLVSAAATERPVLMADMDEMLPVEDDQNSYLFKLPDGTTDDSLHREYMRSIRTSVGLTANEAEDEWEILDLQRLHNYDEGKDGKWSDPTYYFYNGDYKPRSDIGQSCMEDVNAYYNRTRSETNKEMFSTVETWSGHANFVAAAASGLDPTNISTIAGDVTGAANTATNYANSFAAQKDLDAMLKDLDQLKSSPCYKKLDPTQQEIVDKAYDDFKYWYRSATDQIAATRGIGGICNVCGSANSRVKAPKVDNFLVGLIFATAGEMNSAVGGQMISTSFTSAIITYNDGYKQMKSILRSRSSQLKDPDCKGKPSGGGGGGGRPVPEDGEKEQNKTGNDPSGVVYEGVLENPVEGAVVTLYYAADDNGIMVKEGGSAPTQLKPASDVRTLIPNEATQITGADGRFSWGVPQGLWYVSAEYAGMKGNSNADAAATVRDVPIGGESCNLLPVLPVQLDVNVPLVDPSAPEVESVRVTEEGVYVTFSKYMKESGAASVLAKENYSLASADAALAIADVTAVERGHAPANIDPAETAYTRTVLLKTETPLAPGTDVTLTVGKTVASYAETPMTADYSVTQTAAQTTALPAPVFAVASGEVRRGDAVALSLPAGAPENAKIFYAVGDGEPTEVYDGPVAVTGDMTIRAVARCVGFADSAVVSASYTVERAITPTPEPGSGSGSGAGAASTAPSTPAETPAKRPFTDVASGAWYYNAVYYCFDKGYFNGTSADRFTPDGTMTRAMFATVLYRMAGEPGVAGKSPFKDVEAGKWYTNAIIWASGKKVIEGYGGGIFGTNDPVTREQMVTLFWRYHGKPTAAAADLSSFRDAEEISAWAKDAFRWAVSVGVVSGKGGGVLDPKGTATRAEVAQIVTNDAAKTGA